MTNLVAIKSIFAPVRPVSVAGLFTVQGLFLTRQREVSTAFAAFVAEKILTPELIWAEVLRGPRRPELEALVEDYAAR